MEHRSCRAGKEPIFRLVFLEFIRSPSEGGRSVDQIELSIKLGRRCADHLCLSFR